MFKHVLKRVDSEGSESGSEHEHEFQSDHEDVDDGDELNGETEGSGEEAGFAAFGDGGEVDDEELPEHLPSVEDAAKNPVFEIKRDPKGRKTLVCCVCPDKILREGAMQTTHEQSSSHKRRLHRYTTYLTENQAITEETADPRRISAYIDTTLRLKKAGGAGFTIDPSGKRRKRRRNSKKPKTTTMDGDAKSADAKPLLAHQMPSGDGIEILEGKAMNAQQRRKARQNAAKAKGHQAAEKKSGDEEDSSDDGEVERSQMGQHKAKSKPATVNGHKKTSNATNYGRHDNKRSKASGFPNARDSKKAKFAGNSSGGAKALQGKQRTGGKGLKR